MLVMNVTYYLIIVIGFVMLASFLILPPKQERFIKRLVVCLTIFLILFISHYLYFNPNINNEIPVFVFDEREKTGDIGSYDEYYHLDNKCLDMKKGEKYKLILSGEINNNSEFSECQTCYSIFIDKSIN